MSSSKTTPIISEEPDQWMSENYRAIIKCRNSWTKESNSAVSYHWRTEWMKNCHRMKKYTISAQYTVIRDCPTNGAQEELKGTNCMKSKGRLQGSSPLRSDGSWTVRRGGWTAWAVAKGNSRGTIRLESTQIRWFSWWPGRKAGPGDWWPKHTQN